MRRAAWIAAVACLPLAATGARAHEYWLAPSRYSGATGDSVRIECFVGTGFRGERRPWATRRAVRFEARDAALRDLKPGAVNGESRWAALALRDPGGLAVAYQSDFAFIEMNGPEFDAYLDVEGLSGPKRARSESGRASAPARERYARCARTWVAGHEPARITSAVGLTLEVVPERDPSAGGTVPVRILLRGRPLAGVLVRAWCAPPNAHQPALGAAERDSLGPVFQSRADARGRVVLPVRREGEWLVSAVHMEPSTDPTEADWQSWWSSLTFARERVQRSRTSRRTTESPSSSSRAK